MIDKANNEYDTSSNNAVKGLSKLLQLETMARQATSAKALQFIMVNETRRLIPFRQAYLFLSDHPIRRNCHLVAASSVSVFDKHAPFVIWFEKIFKQIFDRESIAKQKQIDQSACPDKLTNEWDKYAIDNALWTPLKMPDGTFIGGLWLGREAAWNYSEKDLVQHIADTYAHAYLSLTGKRKFYRTGRTAKLAVWLLIIAIIAVFLRPIQLSALAPVEVIAAEPFIISAPIDGVITDIFVSPNSYIQKGDAILLFDDTKFRNQYDITDKTLSVVEAELMTANQRAFANSKSKGEVALLQKQVELQSAKLNYHKDLLGKTEVNAEKTGLLLYSDKSDWIGRYVQIGERIMQIADPKKKQLKIRLPVEDAIVIDSKINIDVFLDAAPLNSFHATIKHQSYDAILDEQQNLVYMVYADLDEHASPSFVRIGFQGTVKVYGESVSLFFYLFRRPITFVRQFFGI